MILKLILSIITFKTKLVFKCPPKKRYLFYDNTSSFIEQYLSGNTYSVLHTRLEQINFYILYKSLFYFKKEKFTTRYVLTYIEHTKPQFIISNIDNKISLYRIKNYFSKVKVIVIQNGFRSFTKEGFELPPVDNINLLKSMNLSCDYFIILSKRTKKVYSKFINTKFIETGSVKSNMHKIKGQSNNDVVFISQFASHRWNPRDLDYRITDEIAFKKTVSFCRKQNVKCFVFLRIGSKKEKKYFLSLLKNNSKNIIFIFKKTIGEKFSFLDQCRLSVCVDSTLGYEMISRNKKVLLISARDQYLQKNNLRNTHFGFDEKNFEDEGFFWINRFKKEEEILEKIKEVYFSLNDKILSEYIKYKDALFYVDPDNTKFKKILDENK